MRFRLTRLFFLVFIINLSVMAMGQQLKIILKSWDYEEPVFLDYIDIFQTFSFPWPFKVISGTNTGYGFYGTKVATNKYFFLEYYSSSDSLLGIINKSVMHTTNADGRFDILASKLFGISDDLASNGETMNERQKAIINDYMNLYSKHLGLYMLQGVKNDSIDHYKLSLIAVAPKDHKYITDDISDQLNIATILSSTHCLP